MEFKGTKGNWTVRETATIFTNGSEHRYLEIITDYRLSENHINTIAKLPLDRAECPYSLTVGQINANALLMVESKNLLEALEKARNTLFNCISELPESYQGAARNQAEMCKNVILKATRIV